MFLTSKINFKNQEDNMKKWMIIMLFLLSMIGCKRTQSAEIDKIQNKITEITNKLKAVEEVIPLKAKDGIEDIKNKMEKLDKIMEKLDQIEKKLEQIDKRLDEIEKDYKNTSTEN
jgi:conjugal transfer/entry exclusion protein